MAELILGHFYPNETFRTLISFFFSLVAGGFGSIILSFTTYIYIFLSLFLYFPPSTGQLLQVPAPAWRTAASGTQSLGPRLWPRDELTSRCAFLPRRWLQLGPLPCRRSALNMPPYSRNSPSPLREECKMLLRRADSCLSSGV